MLAMTNGVAMKTCAQTNWSGTYNAAGTLCSNEAEKRVKRIMCLCYAEGNLHRKAGQGRAGQGRAGQGRAGQGKTEQGRARLSRAGQGKTEQVRAGHTSMQQGGAGPSSSKPGIIIAIKHQGMRFT